MCISIGWILFITVSSCEVSNKKDALLYRTYFKVKRNYMFCGLDQKGRIEHFAFLISLQWRLFVFFIARFWFDLIWFFLVHRTKPILQNTDAGRGLENWMFSQISAEIFPPTSRGRWAPCLSVTLMEVLPDKSQWFFTPLAKSCPRGIVRKSQGQICFVSRLF